MPVKIKRPRSSPKTKALPRTGVRGVELTGTWSGAGRAGRRGDGLQRVRERRGETALRWRRSRKAEGEGVSHVGVRGLSVPDGGAGKGGQRSRAVIRTAQGRGHQGKVLRAILGAGGQKPALVKDGRVVGSNTRTLG